MSTHPSRPGVWSNTCRPGLAPRGMNERRQANVGVVRAVHVPRHLARRAQARRVPEERKVALGERRPRRLLREWRLEQRGRQLGCHAHGAASNTDRVGSDCGGGEGRGGVCAASKLEELRCRWALIEERSGAGAWAEWRGGQCTPCKSEAGSGSRGTAAPRPPACSRSAGRRRTPTPSTSTALRACGGSASARRRRSPSDATRRGPRSSAGRWRLQQRASIWAAPPLRNQLGRYFGGVRAAAGEGGGGDAGGGGKRLWRPRRHRRRVGLEGSHHSGGGALSEADCPARPAGNAPDERRAMRARRGRRGLRADTRVAGVDSTGEAWRPAPAPEAAAVRAARQKSLSKAY